MILYLKLVSLESKILKIYFKILKFLSSYINWLFNLEGKKIFAKAEIYDKDMNICTIADSLFIRVNWNADKPNTPRKFE